MVGSHFDAESSCLSSLAYVQILTEIEEKALIFIAPNKTSLSQIPLSRDIKQKRLVSQWHWCANISLMSSWQFCLWLLSVLMTCSWTPPRPKFQLENVILHLSGFLTLSSPFPVCDLIPSLTNPKRQLPILGYLVSKEHHHQLGRAYGRQSGRQLECFFPGLICIEAVKECKKDWEEEPIFDLASPSRDQPGLPTTRGVDQGCHLKLNTFPSGGQPET